ncbi:MAG TPA: hypothetical protein VII23_13380 [Terriglobales bacterium]
MSQAIDSDVLAVTAKIVEAAVGNTAASPLHYPDKVEALIETVANTLQRLKTGDQPKQ